MNYEQKYKESMLIAEHHVMNGSLSQDEAEALFPELRESEDERIRKGLIHHLKELREWKVGSMSPIKVKEHYDAWIAYLEKQKNPLEGYSRGYNDGYYHGVTDQMQKKQKPAEWHPEDERNLNVCLSYIKDEPLRSWLIDAIHVRYDKPAEWSEEDEETLDYIINILDRIGFEEYCKSSRDQDVEEDRLCYKEIQVLKRLKSLRSCPKSSDNWKPSEEQMKALLRAVDDLQGKPYWGYINEVVCDIRDKLM